MKKKILSTSFLFLLVFSTLLAQQKEILVVSQDGTGDFTKIQEAINSVRDFYEKTVEIQIRAGLYPEKIWIPAWKTNLKLVGQDSANTRITGADYAGKSRLHKDGLGLAQYTTYNSYSLLLQGNGCILSNLTIENTAGKVGQAVALHIEADRVVVNQCKITGHQDSFYLAKEGTRIYVKDSYISGTTDFIFGAATAYFENCIIESLSNSYITAASTTAAQKYGFIFMNCSLRAANTSIDKVYLGRPWRPYAKTIFINTHMAGHILAQGWHAWPGDKMFPHKEYTAEYAEINSSGPGAARASARVSWSKQLPRSAAKKYSKQKVFTNWILPSHL